MKGPAHALEYVEVVKRSSARPIDCELGEIHPESARAISATPCDVIVAFVSDRVV